MTEKIPGQHTDWTRTFAIHPKTFLNGGPNKEGGAAWKTTRWSLEEGERTNLPDALELEPILPERVTCHQEGP